MRPEEFAPELFLIKAKVKFHNSWGSQGRLFQQKSATAHHETLWEESLDGQGGR